MEVKLCNCTLFANSKEDSSKYCGIKGLSCLDEVHVKPNPKNILMQITSKSKSLVRHQLDIIVQ
uniref:GK21926 n=1 Tax=Drosophila willistoni TaxID=7260 RepID=B4MQR7_DROWI